MLFKYIVPALAAASGAYAQCSVSATTTVSDAAGATGLAGCATFTGSIAMATSSYGQMTFDGIREITGSLTGLNTLNVTGVSAATLQSIGGMLSLSGMTYVEALNFPELTSVQTLSLVNTGPKLQGLTFTAGINTISSLNIVDTFIQSLTGINPTTAATIYIAENLYLTTIDLPLKSVSGALTVSANANGATALTLSDLTTAGSITIQNVTSLSLPMLDNTTSLFTVSGNQFTSLALPNFTTSAGFAIENNDMMTNFTVPVYSASSQGLSVQNNTALTGTVSFPVLTRVVGAVVILGSFDDISMPSLNSALGGVTIVSDQNIDSTCTHFGDLHSSNVIEGVETCTDTASSTTTSTASSSSGTSSTASGSASAATKSSAASMYYGPSEASAYTVFGMLAAFFGLLM